MMKNPENKVLEGRYEEILSHKETQQKLKNTASLDTLKKMN